MNPVERVLAQLDDAKKHGSGWSARCPAHDDRRPSLSVSEGEDRRALLHCHAGCTQQEVVAALGLEWSDLFPSRSESGKRIIRKYDYRDEKGELLYQVVRFYPKDFRQRRPDGNGGWICNLSSTRRVPYRLRSLVRAVKHGKPVFVVEGEKDAESLWKERLVATTNAGGAGKWRPEYTEPFRGARVVILPDNDAAGRLHARKVATALSGTAAEIRIVELPDLKPGGDVSDWLSNGGTRKKLMRLVARAPVWDGEKDGGEVSNKPKRFRLLTASEVEEMPRQKYLVDGMIPLGGLCEMHGPAGAAKSFLALDVCCKVATHRPWFDRGVHRGSAVYVAAEGSSGLGARVRAWKQHHRFSGALDVHFLTEPVQLLDEMEVSLFIGALEDLPAPPVLIVLDTLARCLVNGDENAAKDMGLAIAAADRIRRSTGATVVLVHHTRKDGSDERGSSALRAALDTMIAVKNDGGMLTIRCEKMKDGPEFVCQRLGLVPVGESCAIGTADAAAMLRGDELSSKEREALESLWSHFPDGGASATAWQRASNLRPRTFYNVRTPLLRRGLVELARKGRQGTYSVSMHGNAVLTANCHQAANVVPKEGDMLPASRPPLRGRQHGSRPSNTTKHRPTTATRQTRRSRFEHRGAQRRTASRADRGGKDAATR